MVWRRKNKALSRVEHASTTQVAGNVGNVSAVTAPREVEICSREIFHPRSPVGGEADRAPAETHHQPHPPPSPSPKHGLAEPDATRCRALPLSWRHELEEHATFSTGDKSAPTPAALPVRCGGSGAVRRAVAPTAPQTIINQTGGSHCTNIR